MARLILHIGMSKCGSSTLQRALSQQPAFQSRSGHPYRYWVLGEAGNLRPASDCSQELDRGPLGLIASSPLKAIAWSPERLEAARQALAKPEGTAILSCEGWSSEYRWMEASGLLHAFPDKVCAVAYLRPPAEWINAAWWQWGAWMRRGFPRWLDFVLGRFRWGDELAAWQRAPFVQALRVRADASDALLDFYDFLDADPPAIPRLNAGLPAEILRMLQACPELRPDAHDPSLDFTLSRKVDFAGLRPPPWVLDVDSLRRVFDATVPQMDSLLDLLPTGEAARLRDDPRWWTPEAYQDRVYEPPEDVELPPSDWARVCRALVNALRVT